MYPYLLEQWTAHWALIPTYSVALAIAYTVAYLEALRRTLKQQLNPRHTEKLFFLIVVASLLGARLFHVLFEELPYYQAHPAKVTAIWEGGFAFYGGALLSVGAIALYCHWQRVSFLAYMDVITASTLLGIAIGRWGCLAAGCCWGKLTQLPWSVTYSHPHTLAGIRYAPVHPVQVYESMGALIIFLLVARLYRQNYRPGKIFAWGLVGYSTLRFALEFLRADTYRGMWLDGRISIAQWLSIVWLVLVGVVLLLKRRIQRRT